MKRCLTLDHPAKVKTIITKFQTYFNSTIDRTYKRGRIPTKLETHKWYLDQIHNFLTDDDEIYYESHIDALILYFNTKLEKCAPNNKSYFESFHNNALFLKEYLINHLQQIQYYEPVFNG